MQIDSRTLDFCLLIPCYNNPEGLLRSLLSINYDPNQFFVLVVDDGSDNPITSDIWSGKVNDRYRIELIRMQKNSGITGSLNTGLAWIYKNIEVKYIARLDCGDTCDPRRFHEQVQWMENNPDCLLLGTWCRFRGTDGNAYTYKTPVDFQSIKKGMHFKNLFIHPTMLFRTTVPGADNVFYPTQYPYAEDYALAWQLMNKGKVAILPKLLVDCELNANGLSAAHRGKQLGSRKNVIKDNAVSNILKFRGYCYLFMLRIIPNSLILRLKIWKG